MTSRDFYRVIEHTADIGLEVEAQDIEGIFVRSGLAVFDLMFGLDSIEKHTRRIIEVEGEDLEELLVAWLNELLYVYAVERMLFCEFLDVDLKEHKFVATGAGEEFDPEKHKVEMEIKAATYHGLVLKKVNGLWKTKIIFDV